ncbi:hypothetical protein BHM03_00035397, partial [Ensete ventricosum]
ACKQMIMVRDEGDAAVEGVEYKHGLTPPMRDARRRRFRREPDLNVVVLTVYYFFLVFVLSVFFLISVPTSFLHEQPEVVQRVEKDLLNIMSGGTVENILATLLQTKMYVLFLCLFLDRSVGLHVETVVPEAGGQRKKNAPVAAAKPDEVHVKSAGGEPERSDSDDSLEPES